MSDFPDSAPTPDNLVRNEGAPPPTDDKTQVLGASENFVPSNSLGENPLPIGHVLQEYVIEGLIGEGGFGIVYLARDTQLGRVVALKEYMPSSLAARGHNAQVSVRSERQRETFELGRRSFVNEAQLLASFDQPSLVKVYRFWEQNGTAYMVMPFYEGPTFKQWLSEHGSPNEAWLLSMLAPLLDALEWMHHSHCFHRDIAPDNILLLKQPPRQRDMAPGVRPVLLDFGAARRVIGDATQALTVILKPGYAPVEQYAESSSMKQGAWTDVYALCAVLYAAVTGRAPQASVSRIVTDELVPAVEAGAGRYSPGFLAAIDAGLAIRPSDRPQDMPSFRALIAEAMPAIERRAPRPPSEGQRASAPVPLDDASARTQVFDPTVAVAHVPPVQTVTATTTASAPSTAPAPLTGATVERTPRTVFAPIPPRDPAYESARSDGYEPPVPSGRGKLVAAGGVAALLVAGGAWWAMAGRPSPDTSLAGPAAQASAPAASAAVAAPPAASVAPVPASQAVLAPTPPLPAPAVPFTLVGALEDIVRHADPLLSVNVLADKSRLTIGSDRLQFRVKSSQSGYLYVFLAGTDKSHFYLLFPNQIDKNNQITANQEVLLPRKSWAITAGGPAGSNHIVTLVSRHPRDFNTAGLQGAGAEIPEFDLARAEQLWVSRAPGTSPFVGQPVCDAGALCDASYGATLLEVEEVAKGKGGR